MIRLKPEYQEMYYFCSQILNYLMMVILYFVYLYFSLNFLNCYYFKKLLFKLGLHLNLYLLNYHYPLKQVKSYFIKNSIIRIVIIRCHSSKHSVC